MVNRGQQLVILHMGHLIGPSIADWHDFYHIKILKFDPPPLPCPINRIIWGKTCFFSVSFYTVVIVCPTKLKRQKSLDFYDTCTCINALI